MNDLQKIFDNCKALYKWCYNDVKAMAKLVSRTFTNIDPKITTIKFDIILQYSLLQIAVADFDFDSNELIFIRDLTEQGDFVEFMNAGAKTNFSWNDFFNTNIISIREILRDTYDLMNELSEEFVAVFALCDKVTEHDFLADLEKNIFLIISGLSIMDGEITKSECNESCLIIESINRIRDLKNN